MVASVSALLHKAAEIEHYCKLLLDSPQTLPERQHTAIEKIARNAVQFSSLVSEKTDVLESGSHQIHMMSHELRTPLSNIMSTAYILIQYLYAPLSEIQRQYLAIILETVDKLIALIDYLMSNAAPWPDA